jgi:hypothetical protein
MHVHWSAHHHLPASMAEPAATFTLIVRGTPRFLSFFFIQSLNVVIYSDISDILLFHVLPLIFSAVLLIFSAHSHIIQTAYASLSLVFQPLCKVPSTVLIFQHLDITLHKFNISLHMILDLLHLYPYISALSPVCILCFSMSIYIFWVVLYSTNSTVDSGSVPSKGP